MNSEDIVKITYNNTTITVPITVTTNYLKKRFLTNEPIALLLPNGVEFPLDEESRTVLKGMDTVLITANSENNEDDNKYICCSLASSQKSNNFLSWNIDRIAFDNTNFEKANNNTTIVIKKGGLYHITCKVLNVAGQNCFPFITVNGNPIIYFYASGGHYQDAGISLYESIPENASIAVTFQTNYANTYSAMDQNYTYLCLYKVK